MKRLGPLAKGRDNNLNLIRMIAALAVLVSHAYPIALGPGAEEPLEALVGQALGGLAVAVFFVISGFLIAESFSRAQSWQGFLVARILRLWPALLVSIALVALVMGPLVTSLSTGSYFADSGVWTFLLQNATLAFPQYTLPGVFEANPYREVEGSIWTLFYEVVCYMGIFAAGLLGLLRRRIVMSVLIAVFAALVLAVAVVEPDLPTRAVNMLSLGLPFAVGCLIWLWKDTLPLTIWGVVGLVVLAIVLRTTPAYGLVLTVTLAYATFWIAYVPGGWLRAYNRVGDYSYGVYIYAFPAQGLAVWLMGGGVMSPWLNMAIALPLTLIPSILSWHMLEKPALAQRKRVTAWVRRTDAVSEI